MNDKTAHIIDMDVSRVRQLARVNPNSILLTQLPPAVSKTMFPGFLGEVTEQCCHHNEASPVATAVHIISHFVAHVGPTVHLQIGNEERKLNNYYLLIGGAGSGKGGASYGPMKISRETDSCLALLCRQACQINSATPVYTPPHRHDGGLSSGEGLASLMNDNKPVNDKRLEIIEPEFGNALNMACRKGSSLSHVLRNGYDGSPISPLTKHKQVSVSKPFFCMTGDITPDELEACHRRSIMNTNGMLSRTLMLWIQPGKYCPVPKAMPPTQVNNLAEQLAERIMTARNGSFETHWQKQQSRPITLGHQAEQLWRAIYSELVNGAGDCKLVRNICHRHRLHCLILAAVFALFDARMVISEDDLRAAIEWIQYAHQSVVYSYHIMEAQNDAQISHSMSAPILNIIGKIQSRKQACTCSDIYHACSNKLTGKRLRAVLDILSTNVPPLISHEKIVNGPGRPTHLIKLTEEGLKLAQFSH